VRQSCCHGGLVPEDRRENAKEVYELVKRSAENATIDAEVAQQLLDKLRGVMEEDDDGGTECVICLEVLEEENAMILKGCQHVFCEPCISKVTSHVCPCCRSPVRMTYLDWWQSGMFLMHRS